MYGLHIKRCNQFKRQEDWGTTKNVSKGHNQEHFSERVLPSSVSCYGVGVQNLIKNLQPMTFEKTTTHTHTQIGHFSVHGMISNSARTPPLQINLTNSPSPNLTKDRQRIKSTRNDFYLEGRLETQEECKKPQIPVPKTTEILSVVFLQLLFFFKKKTLTQKISMQICLQDAKIWTDIRKPHRELKAQRAELGDNLLFNHGHLHTLPQAAK